jgi:hypothetical protein
MNIPTNTRVKTPLGVGIAQGRFSNLEEMISAVLVRLPINEITKAELNKSYCMTPNALLSGLWVFTENEVTL